MGSYLVVLVTCPPRRAKGLATALVRHRVAACVNILPTVQSVFWWGGKPDRAREALLVIKTSAGRFEALKRIVLSLHPYQLPEVIALPIQRAHRPYLAWIESSLRST